MNYNDIGMNKRVLTISAFLFVFICTYAQLSTYELPVSFSIGSKLVETKRAMTTITMPELNMSEIEEEDIKDVEDDIPPRFGYLHRVNYDLDNTGVWYELPNGDKLWQFNVICPSALSVNFCFDRFWIPEGGKFFVYSKDRKHSIGAFTDKNNKGDRDNIRGFATGLVYGNDIILEYYQPKNVTSDAVISIEYVVHGYRYITIGTNGTRHYGESGSCMVNINCEEGQDWQYEKNAVAMIIVNGNRVCTGSLINTTSLSQEPLFLTANHCTSHYGDAMSNSNLDFFSFYWNYEAPGCINPATEPTYYTTSGATILANNPSTDFALLRLTEDPNTISNYNPFYLGWDVSGESGTPGVCIHHPKGDVKKISTVAYPPVLSGYSNLNFWEVYWRPTINGHGTTQPGSSGSALLNGEHNVIGQLYSGTADCDKPAGYNRYGRLDLSWTGNGNNSIYRGLSHWLDSLDSGQQSFQGLFVVSDSIIIETDLNLKCNIKVVAEGCLVIQGSVEMSNKTKVFVESGGVLLIDGGLLSNVTLELKSGSTLKIINGGVLDTLTEFVAPIGAQVLIKYGQIL